MYNNNIIYIVYHIVSQKRHKKTHDIIIVALLCYDGQRIYFIFLCTFSINCYCFQQTSFHLKNTLVVPHYFVTSPLTFSQYKKLSNMNIIEFNLNETIKCKYFNKIGFWYLKSGNFGKLFFWKLKLSFNLHLPNN